LDYLIKGFLTAAGDAYFRSVGHKPLRNGRADSPSSPCNERYFSFQFHGMSPFLIEMCFIKYLNSATDHNGTKGWIEWSSGRLVQTFFKFRVPVNKFRTIQ
jgi:hypothetical protein